VCLCRRVGDLEAIDDYLAIGKGGMTDGEGRSALHYAVAYDRAPAVQALLAGGADSSVCDKTGNPPLHYAAGCVRGWGASGAVQLAGPTGWHRGRQACRCAVAKRGTTDHKLNMPARRLQLLSYAGMGGKSVCACCCSRGPM
jgi:hypothetical protein